MMLRKNKIGIINWLGNDQFGRIMDNNIGKTKDNKKKAYGRQLLAVLLIMVIAAVAFAVGTAFSVKNSSSPVGYWVVKQATLNGIVMTSEDAEAIGLNQIGSISLKKSGKCEVSLMGDEFEGTWIINDDNSLTIKYGDEYTITAVIGDDSVMTAKDESEVEYVLEK